MNDVAHTSFVTVKKPHDMLPSAFAVALLDLEAMGLVGVKCVVDGQFALVERVAKSMPLDARPWVASSKDERVEALLDADAQAGPVAVPGKVESPRPRTSASADRRVVMRAPLTGRKLGATRAKSVEVRHVVERGEQSRARVSSAQTLKAKRPKPRSRKQNGGGNDRAASRKERIVVPEIRVSDVARASRGFVVRVALPDAAAVRALVTALRGLR